MATGVAEKEDELLETRHAAALTMMEAALRREAAGATHEETVRDAELVLHRLGLFDMYTGMVDEDIDCDTDEEWQELEPEEEMYT